MFDIKCKKLLLCLASCLSFSAVYAEKATLSPDFAYVVTVEFPCKVLPGQQFQVVYTMRNDGATDIPITLFGFFPGVFLEFFGGSITNAVADDGTGFVQNPAGTNARWFLLSQDLAPNESKKLTLTLQAGAQGSVDLFVQAVKSGNTFTCNRQITIPIDSDTTCPDSDRITLTTERTPDVIATAAFPKIVDSGQNFVIEYTLTNNSSFTLPPQDLESILPSLLGPDLEPDFIIQNVESSPDTSLESNVDAFPTGRGQGRWNINRDIGLGESVFLRITLQATADAPTFANYITRFRNATGFSSNKCTFGPVVFRIIRPQEPVDVSDPFVDAINSINPCTLGPTF